MTWGAIGGAAVGVIGGAVVNHIGGGSGTGSSSSAQTADPFSSQRYQYQPQLQNLLNGNAGFYSYDPAAQSNMQTLASGGGLAASAKNATDQASAMLQPGYDFQTNDPEYQAMMDLGSQNINRNAAKSGTLMSGNTLSALQSYGQQTAATAYQSQLSNLLGLSSSYSGLDSQQFGQAQTVDQNQQNEFNNRFNQLALLSGATNGSPAAAATQQANQQAGASAQLSKAGTAIWNYATGGDTSSTSTGSATPTSVNTNNALWTQLYGGGDTW